MIHADAAGTRITGDTDGNGVAEIKVCFSREDLQRLFGGLRSASIYPNPLNPTGALSFETGQSGAVRVQLFDTRGRLVRTLLENQVMGAGMHSIPVDGRDDGGKPLSSGIFFYQVLQDRPRRDVSRY